MGKTILNVFKSYYAQLMKIDLVMATKGDLIVADETPLKSMFSSKVCELNLRFIYYEWRKLLLFFNIG